MVIEIINIKEHYYKKTIPFFLMVCCLISYGFPFKFPHNTFNWIQKYGLPEYCYPAFIVIFIVFFILMIVSFFLSPGIGINKDDLIDGVINYKGSSIELREIATYEIEGLYWITYENKTVWKFSGKTKEKSFSLFLLMNFSQKIEFENYLRILVE